MLSKVFFVLFIASIANAVMYQEKLPGIPAAFSGQTGCYLRQQNKVIPFGATIPGDYCSLIDCTTDSIIYTACDKPFTDDPKCKIVDLKKGPVYPDCCLDVQCDTN